MKRSRGFTLVELLVTVTIGGLVTASAGALYLELRVSGARIEAQRNLQREASLAMEVIGRDLRSASSLKTVQDDIELTVGDATVFYVVGEDGLLRINGAERWVIARHASSLDITQDETGGHLVRLDVERSLLEGRVVRLERMIQVGGRR